MALKVSGSTVIDNSKGLTLASGATASSILDEDRMNSNSSTALATQQSIRAYAGIGRKVLISSLASVGTGTTYSVTGLPSTYQAWEVCMYSLSHNSGTSQYLRVALYDGAYSSYDQISTTYTSSDRITGSLIISGTDQANDKHHYSFIWGSSWYQMTVDALTGIRLSWSSGNFDGGQVAIYGILLEE